MTIRLRLPKSALVLMLAGSLALAGCSSQSNTSASYPASTAQALQAQVQAVSQTSADGDFTGSLTILDELDASAKDALARGTIGKERYASISAAVALVRNDLESAISAETNQQPTTGPRPPDPKPGKDDGPGKGKKK
jgi:hypothetical protein